MDTNEGVADTKKNVDGMFVMSEVSSLLDAIKERFGTSEKLTCSFYSDGAGNPLMDIKIDAAKDIGSHLPCSLRGLSPKEIEKRVLPILQFILSDSAPSN